MTRRVLRDLVELIGRDVSYAMRQLAAAPSFAVASIVTLAIGIGATAAVFSLVEAVVLRPLPFAQPDRVVNLHPTRDGSPLPVASNFELTTWSALPRLFSGVAAIVSQGSFALAKGETPTVVTGARITAGYFEVIGTTPQLGRGIISADDQPGAPKVVVLSQRLWKREFDGEPSAVGAQVRIDGEPHTIVGVMRANLDEAGGTDELWIPLAIPIADATEFKSRYLQVVARLAPRVTIAEATLAVNESEKRMAAQMPMWGSGYGAEARSFEDDLVGDLRSRLFILLGAVSCVFLIACVNVASLLLARGSARAGEMAIRTALGANRGRLFGQSLTESAVLSIIAGAAGVVLAHELVRGVIAFSPPGIPRIEQARIDGSVLAFTFGACALCALIVGMIPAFRAAGASLQSTLREGHRAGEGRTRERARSTLVCAEVALAMALLTGAALLIRTAWAIGHVDAGFDGRGVITAQVLLPNAQYPERSSQLATYRAIREAVEATVGVRSASLASSVPLTGSARSGVGAEGQPLTDGARLIVALRLVAPRYFETMKIALHAGRDFDAHDDASAPNVAIINEALARKLWPGQRALGKRIEGMDPSHRHFMEVIGVTSDQRDVSLDQEPEPAFYIPLEQTPDPLWTGLQGSLTIVARTAPDPATMEHAIRRAVDVVNASLPIANVVTMDETIRASRAASRFYMLLVSVLGAIALALAGVGVYGVIAYSVSQRSREIGVRLALGSTPEIIAAHVIRRGLIPVLLGAVVGAALSVAATRLLRSQLYGVGPGDPATMVSIAAVLILVSLVAIYVPARRAMRISPMVALAS
jgi:putative ABC transport system permease protein